MQSYDRLFTNCPDGFVHQIGNTRISDLIIMRDGQSAQVTGRSLTNILRLEYDVAVRLGRRFAQVEFELSDRGRPHFGICGRD
ncbi:MAG: hypothetical protein AAFV37_05045 [Pseudomonadota bacterium]